MADTELGGFLLEHFVHLPEVTLLIRNRIEQRLLDRVENMGRALPFRRVTNGTDSTLSLLSPEQCCICHDVDVVDCSPPIVPGSSPVLHALSTM